MKRTAYLLAGGSTSTRILSYIALVIALASLLMVVQIGYNTLYGPFFEIPGLQLAIGADGVAEIRESFKTGVDEMDQMVEAFEDLSSVTPEERAEIEEELGMTLEEARDCYKQEFINETFGEDTDMTFDKLYEAMERASLHSVLTIMEEIPELQGAEAFTIIKLVYQVLMGVFIFLVSLILLSAVFLKRGLMIFEFILGAVVYLFCGGVVMTTILFVLLIAYCLVLSAANAEWKEYKRSLAED